jgi:hypothetical protein
VIYSRRLGICIATTNDQQADILRAAWRRPRRQAFATRRASPVPDAMYVSTASLADRAFYRKIEQWDREHAAEIAAARKIWGIE